MIDKSLMVHTIYLYPQGLTYKKDGSEDEGIKIEHVRVSPNQVIHTEKGVYIEAGLGNFQIYYEPGISTPLPEGREFSVGDIIKWGQNPNTMSIVKIRPEWGFDSDKPDHLEIWLD